MGSVFLRPTTGSVLMSRHQISALFESYLKIFGDHLLSLSGDSMERWTDFTLAYPGVGDFLARSALVVALVCLLAFSFFFGKCIAWILVFLISLTVRMIRRGIHPLVTISRPASKAMTVAASVNSKRGEYLPSRLQPSSVDASHRGAAGSAGGVTARQVGLPPSPWTYGLILDTSDVGRLKTRPDIARARRDGPLRGLGQVVWEVSRLTEVARGGTTGRIRTYEVDGRVVSWVGSRQVSCRGVTELGILTAAQRALIDLCLGNEIMW